MAAIVADCAKFVQNRIAWKGEAAETRMVIGAGERSRTSDPRITNALLYQLSYAGFLNPYLLRILTTTSMLSMHFPLGNSGKCFNEICSAPMSWISPVSMSYK